MQTRSALKINQAVLFALILREIRTRLYARRFGAMWLLLEPIAHTAALLAFITIIRGRAMLGFDAPMFYFVGIAPFVLMRNICLRMMEAVSANQSLFAYRQIKPLDTMLARLVVEVALAACVYVLISLGMGIFLGYDVRTHHPAEWAGILLLGIALSFSIGVLLCLVAEAIPELKGFFHVVFLPLYFISGVIFPIWLLPEWLLPWIIWNPFLHIVDGLRWAVFEHYPETLGINTAYPFKVTACSLFIALGLYHARKLRLVGL